MIYYTGDIHGDPYEVIQFCDSKKLTEQDEESSCRRKADDALHPRQP